MPATTRCSVGWRRYWSRPRANVVRAVNHNMVLAYWLIGREIVLELQRGKDRAGYGDRVIEALSFRLTAGYGKGSSAVTLRAFRQFYTVYLDYVTCLNGPDNNTRGQCDKICFPLGSEFRLGVEPALTWSHYRALMRVESPAARQFYEKEAVSAGWNKRELERQIHTHCYERLMATQRRGTKAPPTGVSASRREPGSGAVAACSAAATLDNPFDALKDPYVLEFLDIPDPAALHESGIEGAIIAHLRDFLLELGKGFAFVARQKRLSFDDEHLYVDLVFYSIPLRCYLLIDLKTGKLTPGDVGQMDSYVRMFDDLMAGPEDNPTIGLILCTEHNAAVARYSVLNDRRQIFASRYVTCLPTEAELAAEIQRTRALIEKRGD